MMAMWFLGISWAEWVAGLLAQLAGSETVAGQVLDPARALATSTHVFGVIGVFATGVGVLFLGLSPWLSRWSHDADRTDDRVAHEPIAPTVDGDLQAVNPIVLEAERRR